VVFFGFCAAGVCMLFFLASYVFATRRCQRRRCVFRLFVNRVRSFVRTNLLPRYLMNSLSNLDETYIHVLFLTWLDFKRSKVKVTAGRRDGEGVHVEASSPFSGLPCLSGLPC